MTTTPNHTSVPTITPTPTIPSREVTILVDDFNSQPYPGEPIYYFNRLQGERGAVNGSILEWGKGQVTTKIAPDTTWGGVSMSLNHPFSEGLPINFSAILPAQIQPAYQSQIVGITAVILDGTPGKTFRLELKDSGELQWSGEVPLDGGPQTVMFGLPALGNIDELLWILDGASVNDYVTLNNVSFTTKTQIMDMETAVFVWSYGMLLNNWNPETGLVRDKAKDASGIFDAIQATGSLAAATAMAEQLGIVSRADAINIVNKISETLLTDVPSLHGLWPHFVTTSPTNELNIVAGTEWSSVDTAIAAIGLLSAQSGLGLDTSGVKQMLQAVDWEALTSDKGISHGYTYSGEVLPSHWDVFGSESWLAGLAYAAATGQVASIPTSSPPTANGSGFIDEMAWLFVPPPNQDYWGNDWTVYRETAVSNQLVYYPTNHPDSCFSQLGLFGLSAAEIPDAAMAANGDVYQAFGTGGLFTGPNDGTGFGTAVIVPHYSAMIASLHPQEAAQMWEWLIRHGYFSPLNNVESFTFPTRLNCNPEAAAWNSLKGSWNLSLQTLGWGRYLAERNGQEPILWQATANNPFLNSGYLLMTGEETAETTMPTMWPFERECENPDEYSVGQTIERPNASAANVHGQFGAAGEAPWPEQTGFVKYDNIETPRSEHLYLQIQYSKNSPSDVPIRVFLDDEPEPRVTFSPGDLGSWEEFAWTEPLLLGTIEAGVHTIKFETDGQQYGVADLDKFVLLAELP